MEWDHTLRGNTWESFRINEQNESLNSGKLTNITPGTWKNRIKLQNKQSKENHLKQPREQRFPVKEWQEQWASQYTNGSQRQQDSIFWIPGAQGCRLRIAQWDILGMFCTSASGGMYQGIYCSMDLSKILYHLKMHWRYVGTATYEDKGKWLNLEDDK